MALWLVKLLFIEYLVIMAAAIVKKDWALLTYFGGAAILTVGVIWMRQG